MTTQSFETALSDIRTLASSKIELDTLRAARALLVEPAFSRKLGQLLDLLHNQPDERAAIRAALTEARFAFRDQLAARVERHSQTGLIAIGGGTALAAGAVLATATQLVAYPPLAIIPLAIGIYYGWRGALANQRLALEISALDDIIETLDGHIRLATRDD